MIDFNLLSSSSGSPCTFCVIISAMFFRLGKSLGQGVTAATWLLLRPEGDASLRMELGKINVDGGVVGVVLFFSLACVWLVLFSSSESESK